MIADLHIHALAEVSVTGNRLLKDMDSAGVEKIGLISWYGKDLREQREHILALKPILRESKERLYGLAWIEPRHKPPLDLLDWVLEQGYRGFKMIPNRWYPYEERILRCCEKIASLDVPCLFHSGILYFHTFSSRFCRPAFYEELLRIPGFRFALAHVSWPWTNECIALYGQARSAVNGGAVGRGYSTAQMFVDLTRGTPEIYREDVFRKLIAFQAEDHMIFGSDVVLGSIAGLKDHVRKDRGILRKLKAGPSAMDKIFYRNFLKFFGEGGTSATRRLPDI